MTEITPGSKIHNACSVDDLKDSARKILPLKELIDGLLPHQDSIEEEYRLGFKGLLQEPVEGPKPNGQKPTSNTKDLNDVAEYGPSHAAASPIPLVPSASHLRARSLHVFLV